mmetsp:Transcript_40865/g.132402  ORF Transcript_40865/g.132402 Transcript_40865/m.132402 type:complete len:299 (-) Transcript_40865:1047-1943(-)
MLDTGSDCRELKRLARGRRVKVHFEAAKVAVQRRGQVGPHHLAQRPLERRRVGREPTCLHVAGKLEADADSAGGAEAELRDVVVVADGGDGAHHQLRGGHAVDSLVEELKVAPVRPVQRLLKDAKRLVRLRLRDVCVDRADAAGQVPEGAVEEGGADGAVEAGFEIAAHLAHRVGRVEIENLVICGARIQRGRLGERQLVRDALAAEAEVHRGEACGGSHRGEEGPLAPLDQPPVAALDAAQREARLLEEGAARALRHQKFVVFRVLRGWHVPAAREPVRGGRLVRAALRLPSSDRVE